MKLLILYETLGRESRDLLISRRQVYDAEKIKNPALEKLLHFTGSPEQPRDSLKPAQLGLESEPDFLPPVTPV